MNRYRKDIFIIYLVTGILVLLYPALSSFSFEYSLKIKAANLFIIAGLIIESTLLKEDISKNTKDSGISSSLVFCFLTLFISYYRFFKIAPVMDGFLWNILFLPGVIFFVVGVFLRFKAKSDLKENFTYSVQIRDGHEFVKNGIYSVVRHPAYLGTFMAMIGITLLYGVYPGFLLMALFSPFTLSRIKREEGLLIKHFGEDYLSYKKEVGLFPW